MSKKSVSIYDLVSRIERAPNVSRLIDAYDAYDAAVGGEDGTDVSAHRYQGRWQIWHGQGSGLCGDFSEIRSHLAARAEEILEQAASAAAQVAPKQAMVPLPVQQQQADASAALAEPAPALPAQHTVEICAVANDYNSRMRGGTYYQILFRPDGAGGYLPGVRADQADGAVILSRASYVDKHASYARARDRSSETRVRITLPVGTLRKSTRGWVKRLNADGAWSDIELVGNMRKGDGWATIVMIDDVEIELT